MKVLHLISGGDTGGARTHVYSLLSTLKKMARVKVVVFIDGEFYDGLKALDIDATLLRQKSRFDLSIVSALAEMILDGGFDVVHSHGARANFIAWQLKRRVPCPVITTIHSDYMMDFDGVYRKIFYTGLNILALKYMDYYIAVSNSFKDMLTDRGYRHNDIFTVYNGMNFDSEFSFQSREEFARRLGIVPRPGEMFVGIIGRHDKVKGHDVFLRAAQIVAKKYENVRFIIAGDGEGERELLRLAEELGIADKIIFAGFVNDIYSFINFIDINTLTSRSESFPYVLLEGARLSKPTVSSAVGGIPDLIEDGKTGLLFKNGDYEAAAVQILRLLNDEALRKSLGESLHHKAISKFSSESLANRHLEIYKSIINYKSGKYKYDVCLSGYYGFNNSGDDALLYAILEGLRKVKPDIRILVLSANPKRTMKAYRIETRNRFNVPAVLKALKNCKMLINGGGSLIQDATSSQSLWYYTTVIKLAKKFGAKVYLLANGIGPVSDKNLKRAAEAIALSDMITLRDGMSVSEIERMGIDTANVKITADPAVALAGSSDEEVERIMSREGIIPGGSYIGISVRSWGKNDRNFAEKIAKTADYAYEKHGLIPVFIPMKYPSDLRFSQKIINLMKNRAYVLNRQYGVFDIIGIVRKMDLILGMRLHTLIFAAGAAVPIIGLVYDPKVAGFMEYVEQSYVMDVNNIDEGELCGYIDEIAGGMAEITKELIQNSHGLRDRAMENFKIAAEMLDNK